MILPIVYPPIETYQGSAFILGIMKAHENVEDVYYNHYINLECNDTSDILNINLEFSNVLWGYYWSEGVAELNLYFIRNIAKDKAFGFLKERIKQGNYLIFYGLDEYYLSYSQNYRKRHYIHDTYVYGYEEMAFCVMAYQQGKLAMFKVPYWEIEDALYELEEQQKDVSFCTFRISQTVRVTFDRNLIKKEYSNYFHAVSSGEPSMGIVYGIEVYDVVIRCLEKLVVTERDKMRGIDLRVFRCLWEHKKVMKDRADKLQGGWEAGIGRFDLLVGIERAAYKVFMLMMKFNITRDKGIPGRVIRYLEGMKERERLWFEIIKQDS